MFRKTQVLIPILILISTNYAWDYVHILTPPADFLSYLGTGVEIKTAEDEQALSVHFRYFGGYFGGNIKIKFD